MVICIMRRMSSMQQIYKMYKNKKWLPSNRFINWGARGGYGFPRCRTTPWKIPMKLIYSPIIGWLVDPVQRISVKLTAPCLSKPLTSPSRWSSPSPYTGSDRGRKRKSEWQLDRDSWRRPGKQNLIKSCDIQLQIRVTLELDSLSLWRSAVQSLAVKYIFSENVAQQISFVFNHQETRFK